MYASTYHHWHSQDVKAGVAVYMDMNAEHCEVSVNELLLNEGMEDSVSASDLILYMQPIYSYTYKHILCCQNAGYCNLLDTLELPQLVVVPSRDSSHNRPSSSVNFAPSICMN